MTRHCSNEYIADFGISSSADFRFKGGGNHGLGSVFIYVINAGPMATSISYPGNNKFSDEGGKAIKGNLIYFIRNDNAKVERQFDFLMADKSEGLTQAGMARLNQSTEVFVYCILGSQVSVRSSILGSSGSAKEVQHEFLVLVEDAFRKPDISKSVQGFQLAIDEANVRLDLAVSSGTWLMPSNLLLNTQSTVGYNNSLKKASSDVKLGVDKSVNLEIKSVGVRHINGDSSEIKRPTSQAQRADHPSNKIKNTSTEVQVKRLERLSSTDSKTNHDMVKVRLISAGLVSAFLVHRLLF